MPTLPAVSRAIGEPSPVGILGGSGLYDLSGLGEMEEVPVVTPFGPPSAPPLVGRLGGRPVFFIPRHGRDHRYLPSEINYRANVHALKQLGAERVISVSAVGSLREEIEPGQIVLVDQFIDRTFRRETTFFGGGCAGHVSFADPVCPHLSRHITSAARGSGARQGLLHLGGTYVCMEGPQFSTRAESAWHRALGASVIGMTGVTEAKLCREAELCFSLLALVTDYDCWRAGEESVNAMAVLNVLKTSIAGAEDILGRAIATLTDERPCACGSAAENAIMTGKDAIKRDVRERLETLYGRYFE